MTQSGVEDSQEIYVRCASISDLPSIVSTHCLAFPAFFLTRLGPSVLHVYYSAVLMATGGMLAVAISREVVVGFAAGTASRRALYWELGRKLPGFAGAAMHAFLSGSVGLKELVGLSRRFFFGLRVSPAYSCPQSIAGKNFELTSLAVNPSFQGKGCGKKLVSYTLQNSERMGMLSVSVFTDALGNDGVISFYHNQGFVNRNLLVRHDGRQLLHCWRYV